MARILVVDLAAASPFLNRGGAAARDKKVTFIEIYNENTFDLLRPEGSEKRDLPIKQDAKGKTFVVDVTKCEIDPTDLKASSRPLDLWSPGHLGRGSHSRLRVQLRALRRG